MTPRGWTIADISREYQIPERTLRQRVKVRLSLKDAPGIVRLIPAEVRAIVAPGKRGRPARSR